MPRNHIGTKPRTVHYLLRLDQPAKDDSDQNRPELARIYSAHTPQFKEIYGWRNRSESMHARIKDRMPKIPALGMQRQSLFLLAIQLCINAESEYMWHLQKQINSSFPE